MNVFLPVLIVLVSYKAKFCFKNNNEFYLSRECTDAVKGFFILWVLFRHLTSYITDYSDLDKRILLYNYYLDQLIVVMFLFYSGYGIASAIKNKKDVYMKSFLNKRIFQTLVRFDIVVLLYFVLGHFTGRDFSAKKLLLSFVAWESVGNSNWYIFTIVMLYLITYLAYRLSKKEVVFWGTLVFLTVVYIFLMTGFKEVYWYNTAFAYVFGMIYARCEEQIRKVLNKNLVWLSVFVINLVVYHYSRTYSDILLLYEIMSVSFALFVVMLTMKIKISNEYLVFLGKNLFPMYILQRIPMQLLKDTVITTNNTVFFIYALMFTIILTCIYNGIEQLGTKLITKSQTACNKT